MYLLRIGDPCDGQAFRQCAHRHDAISSINYVPVTGKQIIYSGLIVALGKAGPIEALKMSKSLSMENGYSLLGSIFLMMLMLALPVAFFMSSPMETFQAQGGFGTISMIIYNLVNAWFSFVVLNHMIIIAYKYAVLKKG